ncbi:MAG: transposase, partial [Euryarchaeota archaeon]|nr:transposase [Euryarchaeota archaeon]
SITCHKCGAKGVRIKRLFKCSCGLEYNADLNGAINIANRFLDYMFGNRAVCEPAHNQGFVQLRLDSERLTNQCATLETIRHL